MGEREAGDTGRLTGQLLVAGPTLLDPNFHRSVVLVCDHDENGAMGVILNRPTDIDPGEYVPTWVPLLQPPPVVFVGGPVQRETAIGLGRRPAGAGGEGWLHVIHEIGLFDVARVPDDYPGIHSVRVFSGYSGWVAKQLEAEVASGDWIVVTAHPDDAFAVDPLRLWQTVLRRQHGSVAMLSTFTADPRLN